MIWRLLRAFPQFVVLFVVFVGSTLAFTYWYFTRSPKARKIDYAAIERARQYRANQAAKAEERINALVLVDRDLYDSESGELLLTRWLGQNIPMKLFWERESKTVLAQYEKGFVRYGMDGIEKTALIRPEAVGVADDYKWIVFSKGGDIWRADVDWKALKLANERKLTSIGQFPDKLFAETIVLGTEKTLIVQHAGQHLHVDMETGEVHPTKIPMQGIRKRLSPDSKSVIGFQNGQFLCFDVDTGAAKSIQIGRGGINDYQWLANDRCLAIAAMKTLIVYDRLENTLKEVMALPFQCNRVGDPSPDGRFVFCAGLHGGAVIDLDKKSALPVLGGRAITWVSNDSFASSREVADSAQRGTWLQTVGQAEKRVSPEPYLVGNNGGFIMVLPSGGLVVFETNSGLFRMQPDGSDCVETAKLPFHATRVTGIQEWKGNQLTR